MRRTCLVGWRLTITSFPPVRLVRRGRSPLGLIWRDVPSVKAKSARLWRETWSISCWGLSLFSQNQCIGAAHTSLGLSLFTYSYNAHINVKLQSGQLLHSSSVSFFLTLCSCFIRTNKRLYSWLYNLQVLIIQQIKHSS